MPCEEIGRIARIETRQDHVAEAINKLDNKLENKLDQILHHLGRVEAMEQKQLSHNEGLARAFVKLETLETTTSSLLSRHLEHVTQIKTLTRVAVVLWAVLGGSVTYVISKYLLGT